MNSELRPTGIEAIGNVSWGTHFCHFYETEKDLLSILVPFFKAGLENNEYCLWVTSVHISVEQALIALEEAVPQLDQHLQRGSIDIVPHTDWYLKNGKLDLKSSLPAIVDRLRVALQQNFDGLRFNGDESWLNRKDWKAFIEYERALNPLIVHKQLIIMCTYPLYEAMAVNDLLDITMVHECAVIKRKGNWEIIEAPEIKHSKAKMHAENKVLEMDIAQRKAELTKMNNTLNKSQSRLRTIFNTTYIAFLLLDIDFTVLAYNTIAKQWTELSFGIILKEGANFISLLKEDRREPVGEMMHSALKGSNINYETNYPLPDGSNAWYQINIDPVKDVKGQVIGICFSAIDITASKTAELETMKVSKDLVQRNKDLEQFAYIVSHNLRAPLANIIGLSKMLKQDNIRSNEKDELEEFLFQSVLKLDDIVKDLNHILQVRRNISESKETVNFSELVTNILTGFQLVIEQEHIKVITDFSQVDEIFTIKSYLYSIFYNLISNSIKYRQTDTPLVIDIKSLIKDNMVIISFKDNARGIDLAAKGEEVFGLYKRFHIDIEGKGIGLYMVKNQVESLGGDIHVDSQPNIGSTFSVELPIR